MKKQKQSVSNKVMNRPRKGMHRISFDLNEKAYALFRAYMALVGGVKSESQEALESLQRDIEAVMDSIAEKEIKEIFGIKA